MAVSERVNNQQSNSPKFRVLLLGGTAEAFALANKLAALSFDIISSLAGRTQNPKLPNTQTRIGGFGGVIGLKNYLTEQKFDYVIDATHPFAKKITENAINATKELAIPLLRLERKAWQPQAGDHWTFVNSEAEAASLLKPKSNCFLALGKQHISPFANRNDVNFIARMLEPADSAKKFNSIVQVIAKPTNSHDELRFLQKYQIDTIVCRNSGGKQSYQKLIAARYLALPVIMIQRAALPEIVTVETVEEAKRYLLDTRNRLKT